MWWPGPPEWLIKHALDTRAHALQALLFKTRGELIAQRSGLNAVFLRDLRERLAPFELQTDGLRSQVQNRCAEAHQIWAHSGTPTGFARSAARADWRHTPLEFTWGGWARSIATVKSFLDALAEPIDPVIEALAHLVMSFLEQRGHIGPSFRQGVAHGLFG